MPTYCYKPLNGEVVDYIFRMGKAPETVKLEDGTTAVRDRVSEHVAVPARKGWPLECYASGVHPDQAQELRDHLRGRGVPTEVSRDGNPIYRDAQHRKRALKVRGFHDRQSF